MAGKKNVITGAKTNMRTGEHTLVGQDIKTYKACQNKRPVKAGSVPGGRRRREAKQKERPVDGQ